MKLVLVSFTLFYSTSYMCIYSMALESGRHVERWNPGSLGVSEFTGLERWNGMEE